MGDENKRNFFRVFYPLGVMPTIAIRGWEYSVREFSEQGINVASTDRWEFRVGDGISGELVFTNGESEQVMGKIIRISHDSFVIGMVQGITQKRVVSEQRKLMHRFPTVRNEFQS